MHYTVDLSQEWNYENGFYLTCGTGRIGKLLGQWEIYQQIVDIPSDILEFGVYKGASLVRLLSFRDLLETTYSRKVYGFDAFGKFPDDISLEEDQQFIRVFEQEGGHGISKEELEKLLERKGIKNYELIAGDIRETLHPFLKANPHLRIALLHIDVDVYDATKFILENLYDRVVKNGIIMLDDYGVVAGETIAVEEFFKDKNIKILKNPFYRSPSFIVKE